CVFVRAGNASSQTAGVDQQRPAMTSAPLLTRLSGGQRLPDRLHCDVRAPLDDLPAELDRLLFRHDADPVDGRLVRRDALLQPDILRIAGHQYGGEAVIVVDAVGGEFFRNPALGRELPDRGTARHGRLAPIVILRNVVYAGG